MIIVAELHTVQLSGYGATEWRTISDHDFVTLNARVVVLEQTRIYTDCFAVM